MAPPLFQVSYPDTEILLPNLNVSTVNIKITNEFVTVNASNGNYTQLGSDNIAVSAGSELSKLDVDALHLNNATNTLTVEATNIYFASVGDNVSVAIGSVDGVTLTSGPFKPTSILDSSNASGSSGQVLSAGAGGELSWVTSTSGFVGTADANLSMSSYNVNFNSGTGKISTMNVSGISFTVSGTTARLSSTTGMYLDSDRTFVVSDGAGASNSVSASNSFISDGTNTLYLGTTSIEFSGTAPMSPLVSIGSTDGITITTGQFQPTSILDSSNATGSSGQVLSAGAGGELSWVTPASGATPTSDLNMSTYNLSWNGGLKLNDDGSGNLAINTLVDETSGRAFTQKYLPINVNISGTPTLAYLQIFI